MCDRGAALVTPAQFHLIEMDAMRQHRTAAGQAEMRVKIVDRRRRAEAVDAKPKAMAPPITLPPKGCACFDRNDQRVVGKDLERTRHEATRDPAASAQSSPSK